ncbi:MAG: cytidylate kinase-like family protein [Prevotellaceae bacterium]|jgi:cytidylate kinase|nr:cytidylate kinase-like family protein [Prevotellaceae bacterium]
MKKRNLTVSIGRQFGSGGREIGKQLAKELGISYYDKELLLVAAKESGLTPEIFEKADEQPHSLTCTLSMGFSPLGVCIPYDDVLSNERLFQLQSDAIRMLSQRESCVIIGRCSDYVLRDSPCLLSVFIHDRTEKRIARIMERLNTGAQEAKELMIKTDKSRAMYYNYFTDKQWGVASSYNFSADVSTMGAKGTVSILKKLVEQFLQSQ